MAEEHTAPRVVRDQPDRIVLEPRAGVAPDPRPSVRIFLGTEDGQDRAERIFVYAVARARDPARRYEIHLMKNLSGFDRSGWRTGFTLYRYAIPDLAGRSGRAIYNDVDQIYLTDPAELFDLPMGDRGYLAVSPTDTSVMLIDCERMAPVWNREAAAGSTKKALIRAAVDGGYAGTLDPGWNARDDELHEGHSKVVHYTELNRQPWRPFPEVYTYHPNPWGMPWYRLEREADGEGFELFCAHAPSQHFVRISRDGAAHDSDDATLTQPSAAAVRRVNALGNAHAVRVHAGGHAAGPALPAAMQRDTDAAEHADWGGAEVVGAVRLLERAPADDVPWLIAETFRRAGSLAYFAVRTDPPDAAVDAHAVRRTAGWYRERIARAAHRFPAVSWVLDVTEAGSGRPVPDATHAADAPAEPPRAWLLLDAHTDPDPLRALAEEMGWRTEEKHLTHSVLARLPNAVLDARATGLDRSSRGTLAPPWPDVVVAAGKHSVPAARFVRARAGGDTRLIHFGRPHAPLDDFDLVLTTSADRVPLTETVSYLPLPPTRWTRGTLDAAATRARNRLADHPRPWVVWWSDGSADGERAVEAHALKRAEALGGTAVCATAEAHAAVDTDGGAAPDPGVVGAADRVVVAAGSPERLARACATEHPVEVVPIPGAGSETPLTTRARHWISERLSHRGTPLQQKGPERAWDRLIARGLVTPPRDPRRAARDAHILGLATVRDHTDAPAVRDAADHRVWAARAARWRLRSGRRVTE